MLLPSNFVNMKSEKSDFCGIWCFCSEKFSEVTEEIEVTEESEVTEGSEVSVVSVVSEVNEVWAWGIWGDKEEFEESEVTEVNEVWEWDLLAVIDSIVLFMYYANLKSGIGSCIAPKAGIARHPAKGMYRAGMFLNSG